MNKSQLFILAEIQRLSKAIRKEDTPKDGVFITGIVIDMLVSVLGDKLTIEEFLDVLVSEDILKPMHNYYTEFFKHYESIK